MWHIHWLVYSRTSNLIGLLWVVALLFLGEVPFLTLFVYCFPNQSCEFLWELQGHPLSKPNISTIYDYVLIQIFPWFENLWTTFTLILQVGRVHIVLKSRWILGELGALNSIFPWKGLKFLCKSLNFLQLWMQWAGKYF